MAKGSNPLYALPTGGGKTVVIAALTAQWEAEGKRSLLVVHRREILQQTAATLKDFGVKPRIIAAGAGEDTPEDDGALTTLAMIQTLARRCGAPLAAAATEEASSATDPTADPTAEAALYFSRGAIDMVVVDEAHHAVANSYRNTLKKACGLQARYVGVTATPFRGDGQGLAGFGFDDIVKGPSVPELIKAGFLVRPQFFIEKLIDTSGVSVATFGDFDTSELSLKARAATDSIVYHFLDKAAIVQTGTGETDKKKKKKKKGAPEVEVRKTLFFAVDVKHSMELCEALKAKGIRAEHIDGTTPQAERDAILERFRTGDVQCLTNCEVATEGFDAPACSAVVLARPTMSRPLYMQMVGRGLRVAPGKSDCLFFDCGDLVLNHGLPTDPMNFSLEDGLIENQKVEIKEEKDLKEEGERLELERDLASPLAKELREMTSHRYLELEVVRLDGDAENEALQSKAGRLAKYELRGMDRGFVFDGFVFETGHTFPDGGVLGLMVANKKSADSKAGEPFEPFDTALYNNRIGHFKSSSDYLRQLVAFIAEPKEGDVRAHFSNLRRMARNRGYKDGWVYFKLEAGWGRKTLMEFRYNFEKWSITDDNMGPSFGSNVPIRVLQPPVGVSTPIPLLPTDEPSPVPTDSPVCVPTTSMPSLEPSFHPSPLEDRVPTPLPLFSVKRANSPTPPF